MQEPCAMGSPFLHTLSPFTKFLVLTALTVGVFFARSPWMLAGMLLYILGLFLLGSARAGALKWLFVPFLLGLPATVAVFVVSYWVEFGDFQAGLWRGLSEGGLFLARILVLLTANILFVRTTDMRRFAECLDALRVPHTIVVLITTVFRFFPFIIAQAQRIVEVQRSRGLRPTHLLWPRRFLPIVIPLLLINMQRAHDMALSLEMRGGLRRRRQASLDLRWPDWAAMVVHGVLVLMVLV